MPQHKLIPFALNLITDAASVTRFRANSWLLNGNRLTVYRVATWGTFYQGC